MNYEPRWERKTDSEERWPLYLALPFQLVLAIASWAAVILLGLWAYGYVGH